MKTVLMAVNVPLIKNAKSNTAYWIINALLRLNLQYIVSYNCLVQNLIRVPEGRDTLRMLLVLQHLLCTKLTRCLTLFCRITLGNVDFHFQKPNLEVYSESKFISQIRTNLKYIGLSSFLDGIP